MFEKNCLFKGGEAGNWCCFMEYRHLPNATVIHRNVLQQEPPLLPEDVIELHLSTRHQVRAVGEGSGQGEVLDADGDAVSDSEQLCRLYAGPAEV